MKSKRITQCNGIARPANYRPVFTTENAKTSKGEALGYRTAICYLAPRNESGVLNVCTDASDGCAASCLFKAGRGAFPKIVSQRIAKTLWLHRDRAHFVACAKYNVALELRRAQRDGMTLCVRVNGTSDLPWFALEMARTFPQVTFYDYTKHPKAWTRTRSNYHLTFSHSEVNGAEALRALKHGLNVAVVFDTKKGQPLPESFLGAPVIDGDVHDLRFLDGYQGAVIGLRAKGPAKRDCSGFVVRQGLVTIAPAA